VCGNGEVRLPLHASPDSRAYIAVYTASGRLYRRIAVSGETASFRLEAEGLYYYQYVAGKKTALSGILVNMQ
jgi:hypothetical protein